MVPSVGRWCRWARGRRLYCCSRQRCCSAFADTAAGKILIMFVMIARYSWCCSAFEGISVAEQRGTALWSARPPWAPCWPSSLRQPRSPWPWPRDWPRPRQPSPSGAARVTSRPCCNNTIILGQDLQKMEKFWESLKSNKKGRSAVCCYQSPVLRGFAARHALTSRYAKSDVKNLLVSF